MIIKKILFGLFVAVNAMSQAAAWDGMKNLHPIERIIELPGQVKLAYTEQGKETGVPVILLHGFSDSRHSYEMILPQLPTGLRVFTISQRGHGNSSKTHKRYRPEDFANDIANFISQKKLGPAIIIGHSMGGTIAQCFAVMYPSLAKALVLVASLSHFDKPQLHEFKKAIDELKDPVDSVFIDEFQRGTVIKPISDTWLNFFISESRKLPAHVWKGVAAGWSRSDYRRELRSFDKPALLIWGDKDTYSLRDDQEDLLKSMKNSRLIVYEDIGHALHWEAPEKFASDITAFINSLYEQHVATKRTPDHRIVSRL